MDLVLTRFPFRWSCTRKQLECLFPQCGLLLRVLLRRFSWNRRPAFLHLPLAIPLAHTSAMQWPLVITARKPLLPVHKLRDQWINVDCYFVFSSASHSLFFSRRSFQFVFSFLFLGIEFLIWLRFCCFIWRQSTILSASRSHVRQSVSDFVVLYGFAIWTSLITICLAKNSSNVVSMILEIKRTRTTLWLSLWQSLVCPRMSYKYNW